MLAEQVEIVHRLWTEERVDFRGRHYTLEDAPAQPKPVQQPQPPLLVGGSGGRGTVEPALRFADEYNTPFVSPEEAAAIREKTRPLRFSVMTGFLVGETRDDMRERADELYARRPREQSLRRLARRLFGALRRRLGRRGRRTAPRVRARRLRPHDAPAPPPHRPRAGAPDRPRARAGTRVTVRRVRDDPRRGRAGTTRLEAFSDGVFAIAATLLVLEFTPHPGATSARQLLHLWPSYLAYVTSFVTIGIIWMNHHHTVSLLARIDRTMLFLNLLLLLTVAFLPFPTKLVAQNLQQRRRAGGRARLHGDVRAHVGHLQHVVELCPRGRRLVAEGRARLGAACDLPRFQPRRADVRGAFVVAFFSPLTAVFLTFAIAAFYLPSAALFDR